jgi:hypothetical protein
MIDGILFFVIEFLKGVSNGNNLAQLFLKILPFASVHSIPHASDFMGDEDPLTAAELKALRIRKTCTTFTSCCDMTFPAFSCFYLLLCP